MNKVSLMAGLLFICVTTTVAAAPAVSGQTGLISTPSADALRPGQFSIGYYDFKSRSESSLAFNVVRNVEMSVAEVRPVASSSQYILNGKYNFMPETLLSPGLAIGIEDAGNRLDRSTYIVASKTLPFGIRLHAGFGGGRLSGFFGGVEKYLAPASITGQNVFPATKLIADYDGHYWNYGARISLLPGFKLDAGRLQHHFYLGLSFSN